LQASILIPPSTPSLPYPALPANVDDSWVLGDDIILPPEGTTTLLSGFRFAVDIYTTMNGVVSVDMAYGIDSLPWPDQRSLLREASMAAKSIVGNLPPDLQLHAAGDAFGDLQYFPPDHPENQIPDDIRQLTKADPGRRRLLQYEIQAANIFISQLATRSYLFQLYHSLRDAHEAEAEHAKVVNGTEGEKVVDEAEQAEEDRVLVLMAEERELLVESLFAVMGAVSQRNLEPNGGTLVVKIRQVASLLLNDPPERKGPLAIKSDEAITKLIDVLMQLERINPAGGSAGDNMTAQDEDDELGYWAELREYQEKFTPGSDFAGSIRRHATWCCDVNTPHRSLALWPSHKLTAAWRTLRIRSLDVGCRFLTPTPRLSINAEC
jgi:hypothetical protein